MELFEISGHHFYFDLENISEFVRINEEEPKNLEDLLNGETEETPSETEIEELKNVPMIDMTKWELVKAMIETILNENGIVDEDMGITKLGKQLSIPSRIAFNTLIKHKLIKIK